MSGRHYSYTHYADANVAENFEARKFSGPIGRYLFDTQDRLLRDALSPLAGRRILDVGTGTGRASIAFARGGAAVTGVDASQEMLNVGRARASDAHVDVDFRLGDAHALDFPDRSFDAAICLRVLMHAPDWRRCIAELCRVAAWRVVVDFPAALSAAVVQSGIRRMASAVGRRVEPYRVLAERDVIEALGAGGLRVVSVHRQFVLPIALHKAIGSLQFTQATERLLAAAGLLRVLGSPVTMVAER